MLSQCIANLAFLYATKKLTLDNTFHDLWRNKTRYTRADLIQRHADLGIAQERGYTRAQLKDLPRETLAWQIAEREANLNQLRANLRELGVNIDQMEHQEGVQ